MKAVVYKGIRKVAVEDIEEAHIQEPTDALLKITSAAICGSDLHMYDGRTSFEEGRSLGHEIMGVIERVGDSVTQIKPGDRVVLPFNISCGDCFNCNRGYTSGCLTTNPDKVGAGYGYAGMGPYQGGQAEYIRVPHADFNCLKVPGEPYDELEDKFILLADIFPTSWHSTELAKVEMGSSVAIYGAGPVGLLAALSAKIKGAAEIYVVDSVPARLEKVEEIGAIPIDFTDGSPVEQIIDIRKHNKKHLDSLRPGEEKMKGVMCGIDAVGYQAHDEGNPDIERPSQVTEDLLELVNPTGNLGIIGAFMPEDPGGVDSNAKQGIYDIPWARLFEKGLTVGSGQCPVKKYNVLLRDLILAGKADPSFIVSHDLPLAAAPDAYAHFDKRDDGYTKVILKPQMSA
jgi:glutathione-independent formaldehyde dehydrogenase